MGRARSQLALQEGTNAGLRKQLAQTEEQYNAKVVPLLLSPPPGLGSQHAPLQTAIPCAQAKELEAARTRLRRLREEETLLREQLQVGPQHFCPSQRRPFPMTGTLSSAGGQGSRCRSD